MFEIVLHEDVPEEIADLPPATQAKLVRLIDKLKVNATGLREPDSKPIRDGLFELRTMGKDIARGLYVYQKGQKIYLLRVFIKKTNRTPPGEISLAFERLRELTND
ncbi:MAG: type II toxin-antitoxin system RelE/ParE family toxin [Enterovibrio sp.]